MRLKSLKLAGFKSFVDPTTLLLPGQRSAIVGPNGCGKSNIIDAIRWVMGGSSRQLRGDSIEDVIFSGTSTRKPVGQATVELVLDNSAGRLGGAYSQYSEIAIRRQVNRDGQSAYYLNGTRCRRRDIQDILLGTGLGPNSYAIIEQGTISRLIEAKPEELRSYLEEAAGISKYKERRRETELRMQHTRDNLARLNDLRDEIQRQLQHLQQQADTAAKYQRLRQDERLLKAQLLTLRWQSATIQLTEYEHTIQQQETELAAATGQLRRLEAEIEQLRSQQFAQQQAQQDAQAAYYQAGLAVTELEQGLKHQQAQLQQWQVEQAGIENDLLRLEQQSQEDAQQSSVLNQQLEQLKPQLTQSQSALQTAQESLQAAEQEQLHWQAQWDSFNQAVAKRSQQTELAQAQIRHLEQTLSSHRQRYERLLEEQTQCTALPQHTDYQLPLSQQLEQLAAAAAHCKTELETIQQAIIQQQQAMQAIQQAIDAGKAELQKLQGQYAAAESMQQAALGQSDKPLQEWLQRFGLSEQQRLGEQLQVESGWETAVEIVLADKIQALCLTEWPAQLVELTDNLPAGTLNLFNTECQAPLKATLKTNSLAAKIKGPGAIADLLAHIYVAADVAEALAYLPQLQSHESIITSSGIWLGHNWLRASKAQNSKVGALQRKKQLQELQAAMTLANQHLEQQIQSLNSIKQELHALQESQVRLQEQKAGLAKQSIELEAQIKVEQVQHEQQQRRHAQLSADLQHYYQQIEQAESALLLAQSTWQEAAAAMTCDPQQHEQLQNARTENQLKLTQAKQAVAELQQKNHQLTLQEQSYQTQLQSIQQSSLRLNEQIGHLQVRLQAIQSSQQQQQADQPKLQIKLDQALQARLLAEEQLQAMRQSLQAIELPFMQYEQESKALIQSIAQLREQIAAQRLAEQGVRVLRETYTQQLAELQYQVDELLTQLPGQVDVEACQAQLERIVKRIERLGPVNLAAIDEYQTQLERKNYLDQQNSDLESALLTLTAAIQKIDLETRSRFKETYLHVNANLQTLFPRLFGGGQATLELTDTDLLEAGVMVMARPPGKRNSSIHLLSGGEKALTAVALVFAIFQLNPAPFCILDEVDAPLDDANVGRFSALVEEMSKQVQFIYISHNKVAMAIAEHLLGVTMQEPGVSRLVSVDIDAALATAAQAYA